MKFDTPSVSIPNKYNVKYLILSGLHSIGHK